MLSRDQAFSLLKEHTPEQNLLFHAVQTEAVMAGLAQRLGKDESLWSITGLLHDLDYSETKDDPEKHGLVSSRILAESLPREALTAIEAHNGERNGTAPETDFDFALRCGESVTGLIMANALVRPNGMQGMKPKSLKKKMKEKAFAASVNRDNIRECEKLGLELGEFFSIAIDSLSRVADEAGLPSGSR
ncbi:MAG: HD domain-containing protein [Desulfovibrionales bacterium]